MSDSSSADGSLFETDWLALREPVDHASRAASLARAAGAYLRRCASDHTPHIVDLGSGTGSNGRYLSGLVPPGSRWTLVDHDARHLQAFVHDARAATRLADLSEPLAPLFDGADLVSASALIDLVSADWICNFGHAVTRAGSAVLIALSVNGDLRFHGEPDPDDARVWQALARDQRRDKGLGRALGPDAPRVLIDCLSRHGYAVTAMPSPWQLDATHAALAEALLRGWAEAAGVQPRDPQAPLTGWARRRADAVAAGRARLTVGHIDVLGLPLTAFERRSRS